FSLRPIGFYESLLAIPIEKPRRRIPVPCDASLRLDRLVLAPTNDGERLAQSNRLVPLFGVLIKRIAKKLLRQRFPRLPLRLRSEECREVVQRLQLVDLIHHYS